MKNTSIEYLGDMPPMQGRLVPSSAQPPSMSPVGARMAALRAREFALPPSVYPPRSGPYDPLEAPPYPTYVRPIASTNTPGPFPRFKTNLQPKVFLPVPNRVRPEGRVPWMVQPLRPPGYWPGHGLPAVVNESPREMRAVAPSLYRQWPRVSGALSGFGDLGTMSVQSPGTDCPPDDTSGGWARWCDCMFAKGSTAWNNCARCSSSPFAGCDSPGVVPTSAQKSWTAPWTSLSNLLKFSAADIAAAGQTVIGQSGPPAPGTPGGPPAPGAPGSGGGFFSSAAGSKTGTYVMVGAGVGVAALALALVARARKRRTA